MERRNRIINNELYKELAKEYDLTEAQVKEIVHTQFTSLRSAMLGLTAKRIVLPKLGSFYYQGKKMHYIDRMSGMNQLHKQLYKNYLKEKRNGSTN